MVLELVVAWLKPCPDNSATSKRPSCALKLGCSEADEPCGCLGQVEEEDFGVFDAGEFYFLLSGDGRTVAGFELRAVEGDAAAHDLNVSVALGLQRVLHCVVGAEYRGVEFVVLADFHRAIATIRRNQQAQLAALFVLRKM